MDVYGLARDMLGDATLGANEVAALRAIDREYWQRVYALRAAGTTVEENEELREWVRKAIRGIVPDGDRRGSPFSGDVENRILR